MMVIVDHVLFLFNFFLMLSLQGKYSFLMLAMGFSHRGHTRNVRQSLSFSWLIALIIYMTEKIMMALY